jgi:very-short-patch-repair endonuclease
MKLIKNLILASRSLRKNQTPWEHKLWFYLRGKRFEGFRFRRQFVIGYYIVDFCCFDKKLVIELDGGQHNEEQNKLSDTERTEFLQSQGFKVIRFWNNEVDENIEAVLMTILENLK